MSYYDFLKNNYENPQYSHVVKSCAMISFASDLTPNSELPLDVMVCLLDLYIPLFRLTAVVPEALTNIGSGIGCTTNTHMNVEDGGMVARGIPKGTNHVVFINPGIRVGFLRTCSRDGCISIPFRVTAFDYESVFIVKQGINLNVTNLSYRGGGDCPDPDTPMIVDVDTTKATLRKIDKSCADKTPIILSENNHPWSLTDDDVLIVGFYLYRGDCVLRMGHEDK
eukprot:PhF_6_TR19804/c0_g1_i2/m.28870